MRNGIVPFLTLAILAIALSVSTAFAGAKPPELDAVIKASAPYGQGTLTRFLFHIYDAEVWTDARQWSYEKPFALSVTYAMSFTKGELTDSTLQEARRVATLSAEQEKQFAAYLGNAYRDIKSGERISAVFMPPDKITFFVNALETVSVKDEIFARAFFGIWLSELTSQPALRSRLLGLHS